ncbi:Maf family protein [Marinobacter sp. X15-166B]|uniref:Maf family protein n=1 Tax=Marinobacter sp. X15-166B TaxID=1897620 RepID=UPI00085BF7CF|nr:Maf family protein [Marinobacter sp. X15-166B]OEY65212.1 septum formation protein Maf [Marinobacter sp. X15-166B]
MHPLVLASASPRRAELLRQMGLAFTVCPVGIDETPMPAEPPREYVVRLAHDKAVAGYRAAADPGVRVLGADTSVVLDGCILGKPVDAADARDTLRRLSGQTHTVMTAIALASATGCTTRLVSTEVRMRTLSEAQIRAYVATGEPMDKAGSYGIQGLGGIFVEELQGNYSAVVGLPVDVTAELLEDSGAPVWQSWPAACRTER